MESNTLTSTFKLVLLGFTVGVVPTRELAEFISTMFKECNLVVSVEECNEEVTFPPEGLDLLNSLKEYYETGETDNEALKEAERMWVDLIEGVFRQEFGTEDK